MKLTRRQKSDNTEQMLDAFQTRIEQLDGDVVSSTSIYSTSYIDETGDAFGEPNMKYTDEDLRKYWESNREDDPVLSEYSDYDSWLHDTLKNTNLREVTEKEIEGGCHGYDKKSTKSSEIEIDEDLEEVTGEEDLMEELDSEFIQSSDELDDLDDTWVELESKSVRDSDGFLTDYTLYYNEMTGEYACMFGDKDIYRPGDGYFDWEGESEDEAYEWFECYSGPGDDDDLFD